MSFQPLGSADIQRALGDLPGWTWRDDALVRSLEFPDFSAALGFIVRVGVAAERLNHHPDIHNSYSRVTLRLTSHDVGGKVTERDFTLARVVQGLGV